MKCIHLAGVVVLTAWCPVSAEVIEIGWGNESELPGGKEADGIRGDFVLRSDRVEAVVSHNAPLRRANMSTFYGEDGVSPGCLYDLTLRGEDNDQLVIYGPCGHGPVSYVRALDDGSGVESVTTSALGKGVFKRHLYECRDGENGIRVTTILRNETGAEETVPLRDDWNRFYETGTEQGIRWAAAVNPAHHAGYALITLQVEGAEKASHPMKLAAGQEVRIERFLAVDRSPLAAFGEAMRVAGRQTRRFSGRVVEKDGASVSDATVQVQVGDTRLNAYTDEHGGFDLHVPVSVEKATVLQIGRSDLEVGVSEESGAIVLEPASAVRFDITDGEGKDLPCKAIFEGINGTPNPDLGPAERAHGCKEQYFSETGQFRVQLPPGEYEVRVLRGPEYGHHAEKVKLEAGAIHVVKARLERQVDSRGWISADFHNHSTPSGDNVCDTDGRLIGLAVEHIEFAPTTEHNRLYDWAPLIEELGLSRFLSTVQGMELTGRGQHFNAFPFTADPYLQDGGAPVWDADPRVSALLLRRWQGEDASRWIQFNHPSLSGLFVDRNNDGLDDGGFVGLGGMVDGTETQNFRTASIMADAPFTISRAQGALTAKTTMVREFIWRQLLNQGHRLVAVAVADAHRVHGNGVGGWRIYLPSPTDEPAEIDWKQLSPHAKAGHITLSTGPFLEVTTDVGGLPGDDVRANGGVELKVRVQCADWQAIDRIQVLVNSRKDPELLFTRDSHPQMFGDGVVQFDQTIPVKLDRDAHLIVVADHRSMTLERGFGTSDQRSLKPCAYNNPIYVDVDGGGFDANGDTLGFPLPGATVTADTARDQLRRAGLEP